MRCVDVWNFGRLRDDLTHISPACYVLYARVTCWQLRQRPSGGRICEIVSDFLWGTRGVSVYACDPRWAQFVSNRMAQLADLSRSDTDMAHSPRRRREGVHSMGESSRTLGPDIASRCLQSWVGRAQGHRASVAEGPRYTRAASQRTAACVPCP